MRYRYRTDEELKDSGVEWIGKIPKDWEVLKLRNIGNISTSSVDKKINEDEKIVNLVNYVDVYNSKTKELFNNNEYMKVSAKEIQISVNNLLKGDVLFTPSSETVHDIGYSAVVMEDLKNTLYSYHLIRLRFNKEMHLNFKKYIFWSNSFLSYLSSRATGTTRKTLSINNFKNNIVTIPSIKEQEKIANFLDKKTSQFDSIISKKEKLIEKLEEAKKSLISEVVTGKVKVVKSDEGYELVKRKSDEMKDSGVEWLGDIPKDWEVIKIKRLSRIGRRASPRPIDNPIYFDEQGEYAWTRISDVSSSDKYLNKTTQRVSELGASLSVKLEPNKLFLSIAASVGKSCITKIKACIHDGFVYFPDLKEYLNDYLYYVFYGEQCYKGLGKLGTQLNLNRETVGDIKIGLSNKNTEVYYITAFLQQELVKIDNLINKINLQIEKLKESKQSLISEAVIGKIEILD